MKTGWLICLVCCGCSTTLGGGIAELLQKNPFGIFAIVVGLLGWGAGVVLSQRIGKLEKAN